MTDFVELLTIALLFCPQCLDKTINFCFACICFYKFIQSLCYNLSNIVFKSTSIIRVLFWFSIHAIDNRLLRARIGIYNFRRPFIKLKFVNSHKKCPATSTLLTTSLPLLLNCFFVNLLPIFQKGFFVTVTSVKPCFAVCAYVLFYLFYDTIFSKILLVNSGDVETNPRPRKSSPVKFSHWNLNGLAAHDFIKLPLTEAFISTHNFDILCLTETFLNSTIDLNDWNINIDGYFILRADHSSNNRRGGICIYFD